MNPINSKVNLGELKKQVESLGGVETFRTGEWLPRLVAQSFRAYYENATPEYFAAKYPSLTQEQIFSKLKRAAVRQAGLVGAVTGIAMSANELTALATGGELFVGLSGNLVLAAITVSADLVGAMAVQLRLVVQVARLYGIELDLNDPDDVWLVLGFAVGGEISQEISQLGARMGSRLAKQAIKKHLTGEILTTAQRLAAKIGFKLLQRTVVSLAVPGVSIATATYLNRRFTSAVADIARKHFRGVMQPQEANNAVLSETATASTHSPSVRRASDEFVSEPPMTRYLWHLFRGCEWELKLETFLVGGLWLARLDTFNDRLEGTIPERNLGLMEKLLGSEKLAASVEEDFRFAAQNAYASCWHMSDGDPSEEAWTQFGDQHAGIALRTNPVCRDQPHVAQTTWDRQGEEAPAEVHPTVFPSPFLQHTLNRRLACWVPSRKVSLGSLASYVSLRSTSLEISPRRANGQAPPC